MFLIAFVISSLMGVSTGFTSVSKTMPLHITSSAFSEGQSIPEKYTCDGQNVSPPIKWSGAPANTKSFAVICEDPDAPSGIFTHWLLYDHPGRTNELAEASSGDGREGVN